MRVTYVGHATVLIEIDGMRLITDPVLRGRIGLLNRHGAPPGPGLTERIDAVLLSHLHLDHADLRSLRRLGRTTSVLAPRGTAKLLRRRGFFAVTELAPGESHRLGALTIRATEAEHSGGRRLFSRASEALGFEVEGSRTIYFAGDTDLFEGMERMHGRLDLALLPVWGWGPNLGPGHLDPERAARAAALLAPKVAVPIHWGTLFPIGLSRLVRHRLVSPPREFELRARELAPQVEVRVLSPGEATSVT